MEAWQDLTVLNTQSRSDSPDSGRLPFHRVIHYTHYADREKRASTLFLLLPPLHGFPDFAQQEELALQIRLGESSSVQLPKVIESLMGHLPLLDQQDWCFVSSASLCFFLFR
jgi:hypothetical protein